MNRPATLLLSAVQAALVVGIGIGAPLALYSLIWAIQYGFAADWLDLWRLSIDTWLLGHGVPLAVTLPEDLVLGLGVPGLETPFRLSLAPLGILLLTLGLAVRSGRRVLRMPHRILGLLATALVFELLVVLLTLLSRTPHTEPELLPALLFPLAVLLIGLYIGARSELRRPRLGNPVSGPGGPAARAREGAFIRMPEWWHDDAARTVRSVLAGGGATVMAVLAAAAVVTTIQLLLSFASVITLYETLHAGVMGGILLTAFQAVLLPNAVIFTASWLIGPGFAVGAGSSVSPIGTQLGPIPALPLLGVIPEQAPAFAFAGLIVPIAAGLLVGILWRGPLIRLLGVGAVGSRVLAGLGIAVSGGLVMALAALMANGAAGPGRLAVVGPDPLAVGLLFAAELVIPVMVGLFASGLSRPGPATITAAEAMTLTPGSRTRLRAVVDEDRPAGSER